MVHEEITLSLRSEINHGHLIVLVSHKQAKCVFRLIQNAISKFKIFHFYKFSAALLTHSMMHSVKGSREREGWKGRERRGGEGREGGIRKF